MVGRQGRRRFGAIRRLPSGRYQVRYRTAGGRSVAAPTTFETKADAGRFLSKIETNMLRGEWADPRLGRTTFGEWADRWLDSTVNLRANTKDGYRSILRRYLRPAFGSYPLGRIDALAVRTWLAKLEADGVGQATRAKAGTCGAAPSTAVSGSRPPRRPGSRASACTTCAPPPGRSPRPPAARCARRWTG